MKDSLFQIATLFNTLTIFIAFDLLPVAEAVDAAGPFGSGTSNIVGRSFA